MRQMNNRQNGARQQNLRRIDERARQSREGSGQGMSPELPGVPSMQVAGIPSGSQQRQRPRAPSPPPQQEAPMQQQMQLPSEVGGGFRPMSGSGFAGFGEQIPQGAMPPMQVPAGSPGGAPMAAGPSPQSSVFTQQLPGGSETQVMPGQTGPGLAGGMQQVPPPLQMPAPGPLPGGQPPGVPKLPGEGPQLGGAGGMGEQGAAAGGDPYADERAQYEALIAEAKADEEAALQGIDADIARAQRRQAEINAAMGGAVGGGLMGGIATTATLGARERAEAQITARERTRNMQLSWLDRQLELKERDINRKFGREMSAQEQANQIELEAVRMGIDLPEEYRKLRDEGKFSEAVDVVDRARSESGGGSAPEIAGNAETYSVGGDFRTKYANHDYEVSTAEMTGAIERMMNAVGLDDEWVGESNFMSGSPGNYRFGGNMNKVEEIKQFFSRYLHENNGAYPGPTALEDFMIEKGYINYN